MAASTITRTTWTNDSGTPASPVGDGTVLNNARLQDIYAAIDALIAATITFGGLVSAEGFGVHNYSAGGTGANVLAVRNTSAGTGNYSELRGGNDSSATVTRIITTSSTYTTVGATYQAGTTIDGSGSGGLNLHSSHASAGIRLFTGGTQRYAIDSVGVHTYLNSSVTSVPLADGSTSSPSLTFSSDADTGLWWSAPSSVPKMSASVGGWEVARLEMANGLQKPVVRIVGNGNSTDHSPRLHVERQSGGGTAPGSIALEAKNGTVYYLWVDTTGDLRVGTTEPNITNGDTVGTVVGTQS